MHLEFLDNNWDGIAHCFLETIEKHSISNLSRDELIALVALHYHRRQVELETERNRLLAEQLEMDRIQNELLREQRALLGEQIALLKLTSPPTTTTPVNKPR